MDNTTILFPLIAMAGLTFFVTARLYFVQYKATKRREVKYGFFSVYQGEAPEFIQAARDHYKNMFELPVLFYLWAVILFASGQVDAADLVLSWLFVISRYIHSFIRATDHTKLLFRLSMFSMGYFLILMGWVKLLIQLIIK
ncbi:MAG: MAPEG family protein [Candidatus Marinimicrobia bacterium]|nr:MAPEG family protein [Candidatus Neomarinimicrobiota bacterium]MBL7031524.1 MAPEG family protein [Candidatus Neomarinimicrobiota bacterium]